MRGKAAERGSVMLSPRKARRVSTDADTISSSPAASRRSRGGCGSRSWGPRTSARVKMPRSASSPTVRPSKALPASIRRSSIENSIWAGESAASMKSTTAGRVASSAMRRPAIVYGDTMRSAPACWSLGSALTARGAAHDEQPGVERPRGQHHVHVVGVRVDRCDQAGSARDARQAQHVVVGGVALHDGVAVRPRPLHGLRVDVEHDHLTPGLAQLARDRGAHAPVAAHDVVARHPVHALLHPSSLPSAAGQVGDQRLRP